MPGKAIERQPRSGSRQPEDVRLLPDHWAIMVRKETFARSFRRAFLPTAKEPPHPVIRIPSSRPISYEASNYQRCRPAREGGVALVKHLKHACRCRQVHHLVPLFRSAAVVVAPPTGRAAGEMRGSEPCVPTTESCRLAAWAKGADGCGRAGSGMWHAGTPGQPSLDRRGWGLGSTSSVWSGFWALSPRLSILAGALPGPAARNDLRQNYPFPSIRARRSPVRSPRRAADVCRPRIGESQQNLKVMLIR
jgi:hypothetical protein